MFQILVFKITIDIVMSSIISGRCNRQSFLAVLKLMLICCCFGTISGTLNVSETNFESLTSSDRQIYRSSRTESRIFDIECEGGHEKLKNSFSWADYLVLCTMLIVSCGIGVFYGFFAGEQTTSSDFLLGGSSMGTFPMAMSLAARYVYTYIKEEYYVCISLNFVFISVL